MRRRFLTIIILALILGISLYLRIYLPYKLVFTGEWIKFTTFDAYYHMGVVDKLIHHIPYVEPFLFFDWLLAGLIWVISLGSPTQHIIDVVGVYYPAILGGITIIPVYFIGKELFNRWAGIISAGLIALLPGEFLGRSILGSTDQHVAETLFTSLIILFLIMAIKNARQGDLTFADLAPRRLRKHIRPIIFSVLAGISFAAYCLTWSGAPLFVFMLSLYFVGQYTFGQFKRKSTDYLCVIGVITFSFALLIFWPLSLGLGVSLLLTSLIIGLLIPPVLSAVSRLIVRKGVNPVYYPLILIALGLAGLAILYVSKQSLFTSMMKAFSVFSPTGVALLTSEEQPLLWPHGSLTLAIAWVQFTFSFFLSLISIGILLYLVFKQDRAEHNLLITWSLIMLAATLGQRRFGYYFSVNVAVLTSYLSLLIYHFVQFFVDYVRGMPTKYGFRHILESPYNQDAKIVSQNSTDERQKKES